MHETNNKKTFNKWTKIIVIDSIILFVIIAIFAVFKPFFYIEKPKEIADFTLSDQHGRPFSKAQLKGHWTFLFFGFTYCPMVCPGIFDSLNQMHEILQKQLSAEQMPQIVFITIDPERDTEARLKQYINSYNPAFIGARTDPIKTKVLEKNFSITVNSNNGNFAHSTEVILINPDAQIQMVFTWPQKAQNMANDYLKIIQTKDDSASYQVHNVNHGHF